MQTILRIGILCLLGFSAVAQVNLSCFDKGQLVVNGSTITITNFKIKNTGFASSGISYLGYYLSTDENFTTSDIFLGQDYVDALSQSQLSTENFMIDLAGMNIPNGTYFVGAIIDHLNQVPEYDETDNNDCYWTTPKATVGGKPNLSCAVTGELTIDNSLIKIYWVKIMNSGTAPAGESKAGFYLSTDNVFTTSDIFMGSVDVPALVPGESVMIDIDVDTDSLNLAPGEYFIGYIIDYLNQVPESNEEDNRGCKFDQKLIVNGIPSGNPDLACKTLGELIVNNNTLDVYIGWTTIQNIGNAAAGASQVGFYLSTDSQFGADDILFATRNIPALQPGASEMISEELNVNLTSLNLAPGLYQVIVVIDHLKQVTESNEDNNDDCFWVEPKVFIPSNTKPDLACKTLGELIVNNNTLDVYIGWTTIQNTGNAAAGASQVGFYLSTDSQFGAGDILFATRNIPALQPGASEMISEELRANLTSLNLAPGLYQVIVVIDHLKQVTESNEDNNDDCFWVEPKVFIPSNTKPDLACKTLGELIVNNNTLDVYVGWTTIQNIGNAAAGASQVGFYLSTDSQFGAGDILFATRNIPALQPSASEMISEQLNVNLTSLNLAPGLYQVIVVIDHLKQVTESNEDNNDDCFWVEPKVFIPNNAKPDLACKALGELIINNNTLDVYIGWTSVQNIGNAAAGASQIGFYASTDNQFSPNDKLIATYNIGALQPGASQVLDPQINVNVTGANLAPGSYQVIVVIDHLKQVTESNEDNNDDCFWNEPKIFIPAPNLKPNLTCLDRGFLTVNGSSVSISQLKIINNGSGQADQSKVGVYLSLDQHFTTTDFLIGKIDIPKLANGSSIITSFQTNVAHLGIPAGDYFVGIITDNDKQVEETNENDNNTCSWATPKVHVAQLLPNLLCFDRGHLSISDTKLTFSSIKIQNNGSAAANASAIGFYLSSDNVITTNDIFIGAVTIPGLNAGQTATLGNFAIDVSFLNLANGTYTIGFITDYNQLVGESNENDNNLCSYDQKLVIQNGKPNLVCDFGGELAVSGTKVDISWVRIKNAGNLKSGATRVGFYLSTDQHFSTSDYFIGSRSLPELLSGAVATLNPFSVDVSSLNIPAGSYFVGILIDDTNQVVESNESDNNTCSFVHPKVTIASPKPNLVCSNLGELTVNGANVHISWTKVQNNGGSTANATKVGYYLSTDTYFTPNDFLIGTADLSALAPGEVRTLPAFNRDLSHLGLPGGTYYVGIFIDPTYLVHETNENDNNTCFWTHPQVHISQAKPNLTCMNRGEVAAYGSAITFSWIKIQNDGGTTASPSRIGYYLSTDTHFATSDVFLGDGYIPSVGAGQVYSVPEFTVNLSHLNLASGEYFLGFIIDYKNEVAESNENDNNDCFYTTPKVVVNPPKSNLTCKDKGELSVSGNSLHYAWGKVMNNGGTTAGASYVGYYLSSDLHFDTNDRRIGEAYIGNLAPGQVATLSDFNVNLANLGLPAGTYYFGFIIDYKGQVAETDENDNNDCFFEHPRIVIGGNTKPNLAFNSSGHLSVSSSTLHINEVKVVNNGGAAAGESYLGYYLSTDAHISPESDILIGEDFVTSLGQGQISIESESINISNLSLQSGTYFVGLFIDYKYQVHESNENDNAHVFSTKITITNNNNSKPDLACLATGMLEVINNEKIKIEGLKVQNIGHGHAGESKIGFYLSLDTHFDQNDYFIDARSVSALAPGQVATLSFYEDIPSGNPPAGKYYLGYILDYDKKIHSNSRFKKK